MYSYIMGIIFLLFFITLTSQLGKKITSNNNFVCNVIIGHVIYCTLQFFGGFLCNFLPSSWLIYKIYMIIVVLGLCYYAFKDVKFDKTITTKLKVHIKVYYPIYLISALLLAVSFFSRAYLTIGNHLDDAYYLLKAATASSYDSLQVNFTSGGLETHGIVRILNTFELDYAFWIDILKIYPSVFCKAVMGYFSFFIYLCGILSFIFAFFKSKIENINWKKVSLCLIILVFAYWSLLNVANLYRSQDTWHFTYAPWYGSTYVRVMTLPILAIPTMYKWSYKNRIIFFIGGCITLVSKAGQAVPAIACVTFAIVLTYYYKEILAYLKKHTIIKYLLIIVTILMLVVICTILPKFINELLAVQMPATTNIYFESLLIKICLAILVLSFLFIKDKRIKSYIICLFLMHIFLLLPGFNNLFILMCGYNFVLARTVTMLSYFTIILAYLCVILVIEKTQFKKYITTVIVIGSLLFTTTYMVHWQMSEGFRGTIGNLIFNPYLIPQSTKELSSYLDAFDEELYVLTPQSVLLSGQAHHPGCFVRIGAPKVISLSPDRFTADGYKGEFANFTSDDALIYHHFNYDSGNVESQEQVGNILEEFPIDILVLTSVEAKDIIESNYNYSLIHTVEDRAITYFVLQRNPS